MTRRRTAPVAGTARDPRWWTRRLRVLFLGAAAVLLVALFRMVTLATVPTGPGGTASLFAFTAERRVFVRRLAPDDVRARDEAVFFARADGTLALGRIVALPGDALEFDAGGGRVRRGGDATWYPVPERLADLLPIAPGHALVLAEEPAARAIGGVIPQQRIVARVVAVLPF